MKVKKFTERDFQRQVETLAKLLRWEGYHTWDSRRSQPGFPDLVLVREGEVIFAELKVGKNKTTLDQQRWGAILSRVGGNVSYYLWRPEDWDDIKRVLEGA